MGPLETGITVVTTTATEADGSNSQAVSYISGAGCLTEIYR